MIALFVIGLAAVAVGPALTILLDSASATPPAPGATSAGMFAAVNDNRSMSARRVA